MKNIIFLLILFFFTACEKEEVKEIIVNDIDGDGNYNIAAQVGLLGNVNFIITPASNNRESIVSLENLSDFPVGYRINDPQESTFVYFYDSYIGPKKTSVKTGAKIPLEKPIYVLMIQYNSKMSYALVQTIEALGLDYFNSLEKYKDNLRVTYSGEIILKKKQ
ncbi:MAG: hypothetical protein MUF50_03315 [Planctomycetes bacterium]|jgi:hypothetical protein|nr:hypothetical protein [Planctomycetota bacterium]